MRLLLVLLLAGCTTAEIQHDLRISVDGDRWDVRVALPIHREGPTQSDWADALRTSFGNGTARVEDGYAHLIGSGQTSFEAIHVAGAAASREPAWTHAIAGEPVVDGHAGLVSLQYDAIAPDGCWREASYWAIDVTGRQALSGTDQNGC